MARFGQLAPAREVFAGQFVADGFQCRHGVPLLVIRISPGKVQITVWDGSTQVYWIEDLRRACHDESY